MKSKPNRSLNSAANLRRTDVRTLYEQLSDRLRAEFAATYVAGNQIPTEEEIGRRYQLSRVTVRRAIQTLVDGGMLIRRQGKGTYLAQPKPRITYEIDRLGPFMAAFDTSGEPVSARLINFNWVTGKHVPALFERTDSALVYERLYETEGMPHAFLRIALPGRIGEKVTREDAASMGVYQILREKVGVTLIRATFNISTELPDAPLARRLQVSPTTPLLVLERISFDADDEVIEHTVHHLLPEVYKLSVNVKKLA
jgi:GntR family transcriptional regulator